MKKIIQVFCALLMLAMSVPAFAGDETILIPDYEPWKYTMTASMGSCRGCDPQYSFKYNFDIRMEELKRDSAYKPDYGNNPLKDFSLTDILMITAVSLAGGMIVYAILVEQAEFIKVSF